MEVKKILWPTDFSSNAEAAQPYVESLSDLYQTEVHVLYVIPELADHEPWYGIFEKSHIDRIHEWEEENAKQRLDEICKNYLQGCPLYIKHTAIGNPAEEILKQTSLFLAQKQPFFWTVDYFKGDFPTSMAKDFPVGVNAFNPVSFRQNCSWAARRLGC